MAFYWVKTHRIIKSFLSGYVWDKKSPGNTVYLTFDDGPTPEVTQWVLQQLENYNAKATFFCIGNNIANNPKIFEQTIAAGHAIGNHTFNHVNGWNAKHDDYIANVLQCETQMPNANLKKLFRPPYGKVTRRQFKSLRAMNYNVIMWDILSADFDNSITPEKCLRNVIDNIEPGSIIIFHDSLKAWKNLQYALPKTLEFLKDKGYDCAALD